MAFKSSTLTYTRPEQDLFAKIRNFVCGFRENDDPVFSNPAKDDVALNMFAEKHDTTAVVTGDWTIECTTGGGNGVAIFSVTSSALGAFGAATAGSHYENAKVCFVINAYGSTFSIGETFTVTVTGESASYTSGEYWALKYQNLSTTLSDNEYQIEGPGLTGDKTINIISRTLSGTGYFNIAYKGATGFNDGGGNWDRNDQPGLYDNNAHMCVQGGHTYGVPANLEYHIVMNRQRFVVLPQAGQTYRGVYAGFYYKYATDGQYPFPCYICSDSNYPGYGYTSTNERIRSFVDPGSSSGKLFLPGGTHADVGHFTVDGAYTSSTDNRIWPYGDPYSRTAAFYMREMEHSLKYPMEPCILEWTTSSPDSMLGELDDVCIIHNDVTGILNPGDIVEHNGDNWVVWKNTFRSTRNNFYAVRLA